MPQISQGNGIVHNMAVWISILSARMPKINAAMAANPLSIKVVMAKAVDLNSGGTTPCIIGSFEPLPGQLINKAVIKHKIPNCRLPQSAVLIKRI